MGSPGDVIPPPGAPREQESWRSCTDTAKRRSHFGPGVPFLPDTGLPEVRLKFRDLGLWPQNSHVRFGEYGLTFRCWALPSASRSPCCPVSSAQLQPSILGGFLFGEDIELQDENFLKK